MSLFGALVRTVVNVAAIPVEVVKDVVTLGDVGGEERGTFTTRRIQRLKDEADDD